MDIGSWEINFAGLPQHIADTLDEFGHVVIDDSRQDPAALGDDLLDGASYVGIVRGRQNSGDSFRLFGPGIAAWLGDEDGKGEIIEAALAFSASAFADVVPALLPDSVQAGTITDVSGSSFTYTFLWQSPREALNYLCDTVNGEWRLNTDFTLDAGPAEDLFVTDPVAVIVRRDTGRQLDLEAFPGSTVSARDLEDFTTRVVLIGQIDGFSDLDVVTATADIDPGLNPYVDRFGNPVVLTRIVDESGTDSGTADARAQLALNRFSGPEQTVTLDTSSYTIHGRVRPGDYVWVWDPEAGAVDTANEIVFRGERLNPIKIRVLGVTRPVQTGAGVYYRASDGTWTDLSDYLVPSDDESTLEIGENRRALTSGSSVVGRVPTDAPDGSDSSVPNTPTWVEGSFSQATYQDDTGLSRAQIGLVWTGPSTNTDGSAFSDGSHFEIRFRRAPFQTGTWAQAAAAGSWSLMGTWGNPIGASGSTDWETRFVGIDVFNTLILDLTPGTRYEFQIRALDSASPPNASAWTASVFLYAAEDSIAPATPAAPVVAGALTQISVKHLLGDDGGGTYNLDLDLAYLEVHASTAGSGFTPDEADDSATRLGKIEATRAQIVGQIPVLGDFPVSTTDELHVKVIAVDQAGNRSAPSAAAAVTAELIPDQWVSDLTATKLTAGDLTASYGLVGLLTTGNPSGARFEAGDDGSNTGFMLRRSTGTLALHGDATTGDLIGYSTDGTTKTFRLEASTGDFYLYKDGTNAALFLDASAGTLEMTGKLTSGDGVGTGNTIVIDPADTTVKFYPDSTTSRVEFNANTFTAPDGSGSAAGLLLRSYNTSSQTDGPSWLLWPDGQWFSFRDTAGNTRGGRLLLYSEGGPGAFLGYQDASVDAYLSVDNVGEYSFKGRFKGNTASGTEDAVYIGFANTSGSSGVARSYGFTMADARVILHSSQGLDTWTYMSAVSATGFTILKGGGALSDAWIHYASFGTDL